MDQLKVKHWAGWLVSENMGKPGWLEMWMGSARIAEAEGCDLVVFKVPKPRAGGMMLVNSDAIDEVERLLQEKYPIAKPG